MVQMENKYNQSTESAEWEGFPPQKKGFSVYDL